MLWKIRQRYAWAITGEILTGVLQAITTFLLDQKGLSKVAIGELMGEPAQKYLDIVEGIVMAINFTDMDLVEALRIFLSKFRLPGEAQKIDRIIETFSKGCVNSIFFLIFNLIWQKGRVVHGVKNSILAIQTAIQTCFPHPMPVMLSRFLSYCSTLHSIIQT